MLFLSTSFIRTVLSTLFQASALGIRRVMSIFIRMAVHNSQVISYFDIWKHPQSMSSVYVGCSSNTVNAIKQSFQNMLSTWNIASKRAFLTFSVNSPCYADAVNTFICNHMAAISYYTASISAKKPISAYACSDYARFEQGHCTSCHSDHSSSGPCQQMGYHASPHSSHGAFYLMTLDNSKPPLFGMLLELSKPKVTMLGFF